MELKLAKDESIVKSWDYAKTKEGRKTNICNFTITNKRIIHNREGNFSIYHDEIQINDITRVSGSFDRNPRILALIKLVLGIALTCTIIGIILFNSIKMIRKAIQSLRFRKFSLSVYYSVKDNGSLSFGTSSGTDNVRKHTFFLFRLFSGRKSRLKVKVNESDAREIINEIGAAIIDAKQN